MSEAVPFTDNIRDLSNTQGYQFEFHCERCGNGYRSAFERDLRETGQNLVRGVSNLFGGSFNNISNAADRLLDRGTNSAAKDKAMRTAVHEIANRFNQCRGCGDWVCAEICWNGQVGQCARCSPIATEEIAQLQAEARRRQIADRLQNTNLTQGLDVGRQAQPRCPSCGAQALGGSFCGECGSSLRQEKTCGSCSTVNPAASRFCCGCGNGLN